MITGDQLVAHLVGDYILQSDWMAIHKTKSNVVALTHAIAYGVAFLWIGSVPAWMIIVLSHAMIDRFGVAKYVVFAKNHLAPKSHWPKWSDTDWHGYDRSKPIWVAGWLFILADNILHLLINAIAIFCAK